MRGEAKQVREIESLTQFYKNTNKLDDITEPTVGIHKFTDASQESVLTKSFGGIVEAAKDQAQMNFCLHEKKSCQSYFQYSKQAQEPSQK